MRHRRLLPVPGRASAELLPLKIEIMPDTKSRILVVEDQAIVAIDIQSQLESLGYLVVGTAASAAEACQKAATMAPDLVLMDVHLGDAIDGIDAAATIREQQGIPIVFLTAYVDSATIRRAQQVEPYGYIVKPFSQRDLHTTLQMALYKGRIDRHLKRSRDDLLAILDAQRHGTALLDERGQITYLSRAALKLVGTTAEAARGRKWPELLRVSPEQQIEIAAMLSTPTGERGKIAVQLEREGQPRAMIEIEAQDDPRDPAGRVLFLYDVSQLYDLRRMLDGKAQFEHIIGKSAAIEQVWQLIREFARVDSTVLIEGDTGVGKELVARAIHNQSRRSAQPFVALNCAGLSDELAASQLFGHRRGAFTGAVDDQVGLFESAHGGTLFLDEIGDLPIRIQTTLLRVLEDRQIMRIGESRTRPIDVRIITATHRDLAQDSAEQRFRTDLLYRIRVARIRIPPLCERREDIPLLIRAFLATHSATTGRQVDQVSDEALRLLLSHDWPGNVRELKNALEFAVIRCHGSVVQVGDLPPEVVADTCADAILANLTGDERSRLLGALERAGGNRTEAAALLGISRATLYRRLAHYGASVS
jgi:PAS domain S-box-containing protein